MFGTGVALGRDGDPASGRPGKGQLIGRRSLHSVRWGLFVTFVAAACSSGTEATEDPLFLPAILEVERAAISINDGIVDVGNTAEIAPGDHVVGDAGGVGTVRLGETELKVMKGTDMVLPDLEPDAGRPLLVQLDSGHLFVDSGPAGDATVEVETSNRRLTTVDAGTKFVICQSPEGKTCVFVIEGAVNWSDDYALVRYETGEGAGAEPGAGPGEKRCDTSKSMSSWLAKVVDGQDADTLIEQLEDDVPLCAEEETDSADGATTTAPPVTTTTAADEPSTEEEPAVQTQDLPSGAGMVHVRLPGYTLGNPGVNDPSSEYMTARQVDSPIEFFIDQSVVTNEAYQRWVLDEAGSHNQMWHDLAPGSWLAGLAENEYFRATYPPGQGAEPVTGVRFEHARAFCLSHEKHLVAEVEWELAAVDELLTDLGAGRQDWVDRSDEYGPGVEPDHVVLRGTNNVTEPDIYFRSQVVDTPESTAVRQRARIRCAAPEVDPATAPEAVEPADEVVYQDDFTSLETGNWPQVEASEQQLLSLAYHPPAVYHLEAGQRHVRGAVVKPIAAFLADGAAPASESGWRLETEVFIERAKTTPDENHRYGVLLGSVDGGFVALTVQSDEVDHSGFVWCLSEVDAELVAELASDGRGWVQAPEGGPAHVMENCRNGIVGGKYAVPDSDDPATLSLAVKSGEASFSINGEELGSEAVSISVEQFGFFVQTFDKERSHVHFDAVTLERT